MDDSVFKAARFILESRSTIALAGSGISVESGIPDFRSKGGLWDHFFSKSTGGQDKEVGRGIGLNL